MGLDIKGVFKTSLIDFPGRIAPVIFLSQCNFRCPYCHNPELINGFEKIPTLPEKEILAFLQSRKDWIDGVVITGGEPTLHSDLPAFLKKVKQLGLLVKVDTNGTNPLMLKKLIGKNLLDYIALDIKAPLEKYSQAVKAKVDLPSLKESVQLIQESGLEYEFRITVVPRIFAEEDCQAIGQWLKGAKKFVLQQFNSEHKVLDSTYQNLRPFPPDKLKSFAEKMQPYFKRVEVRGI